MSKTPQQADPATVLRSWQTLQAFLPSLSEKQCWELLEAERTGQRRFQFMLRLYGRANKLRGKREREDLLTPVK